MNGCRNFFALLLIAFAAAYGQQQERVAILNTEDDGEPPIGHLELSHLTNRLRETAVNILPKQSYGIMTIESIVAFLGSLENVGKVCNESSCLAEVGRKVSADYVAQARIGRFGKQLSINFQLYNSKSGNLIGSFTGNSKDLFGLLTIIDEKAPVLFKQMFEISGVPISVPQLSVPISSSSSSNISGTIETVKIGGQTWLKRNLNAMPAKGKSWCYSNKAENCEKYGRLYNWQAAMSVCPKGFHLPAKEEWDILITAVDAKNIKAASGWNDYEYESGNGTDKYGFSAMPGGAYYYEGFNDIGNIGYWWSASKVSNGINTLAYVLYIYNHRGGYYWNTFHLANEGSSVRCLKD